MISKITIHNFVGSSGSTSTLISCLWKN